MISVIIMEIWNIIVRRKRPVDMCSISLNSADNKIGDTSLDNLSNYLKNMDKLATQAKVAIKFSYGKNIPKEFRYSQD